ncbi:patatin-like phospholipase family protein [Cryptosporangium phraense]|uniref:Patatin-like phospholipase family protein n=1 Tax=Cryptosporangium phraense TaxID=2593070 RepID=A0A545AF73_9ACTN|nr:patatin-like phospholipase family protein [Cryptosporangium phraense]TQS39982.1 patatin-like phospholipase family protein [Cryptosporangium phraense]
MTGSALVLGGGGVTGIAWEIGLLAGLLDAGVDLTTADLIVGTSAGSVVGAVVATGSDIEDLYRSQLEPPTNEIAARMTTAMLLRWGFAAVTSRSPERFRARVGALARRTRTVTPEERRRVIASRLPVHEWPNRRLVLTAVDADTGELQPFDRTSGVPLVDAVSASCAVPGVWPPVTINGREYIDGGVRSTANVDLAAGCDRIVVLAPIPKGGGPMPAVSAQVARLGDSARVAVVTPNPTARAAFGRNVLDPSRRGPSARAGRAQAADAAMAVHSIWSAA